MSDQTSRHECQEDLTLNQPCASASLPEHLLARRGDPASPSPRPAWRRRTGWRSGSRGHWAADSPPTSPWDHPTLSPPPPPPLPSPSSWRTPTSRGHRTEASLQFSFLNINFPFPGLFYRPCSLLY